MLKKVPASDRLRGTRVRGGMGYTVALEAAAARIVGSTPTVPTKCRIRRSEHEPSKLVEGVRIPHAAPINSSASGGMGYTSG